MEQDKFDVFISYSRKELDRVKQIKSVIEDTVKTKCWMDLNAIESGSSRFTKDIVEGINQCQVFLFMFSENSQNSKFALRELDFAEKKGKHIVIVNIDSCTMNDEFMFLYGLSDTITWDDEPQREKILRDLKKWVGLGEDVRDEMLSDCKIDEWNKRGEDAANAKNYAEAFRWFRKSAELGDAYAQFKVGAMYQFGCGVELDFAEAAYWLRKSAEQGNAAAQDNLGDLYYCGYGVEQDYAEAVSWYRKSAEQGNADAQFNLGFMFQSGDGVTQDYAEAIRWYRMSAAQRFGIAQYYLGTMYENGYGVQKNIKEAIEWYRKAAEQGYEKAKKRLVELSR